MAPVFIIDAGVLALIATLFEQFIPEVKVRSNFEVLIAFA